jgi:N-acetylmuramoyl-L-alanine amidase
MLTFFLALTVVIDPGHGGSNTGAPGRAAGSYEKQVTLGIARALKQRLEDEGVRVVLTRDRDAYLTLRERARLANAEKPDLFISLHTNASPEHGRRGIETYVLARDSVDVEARRAASRAPDVVQSLLTELSFLEAHRASLGLARAVQARLCDARSAATSDRGVRQAAFDVLAGIEAPAVLVEVGFIDHPIEGPELATGEVQEKIAAALASGIFDFASTGKPVMLSSRDAPRRSTP